MVDQSSLTPASTLTKGYDVVLTSLITIIPLVYIFFLIKMWRTTTRTPAPQPLRAAEQQPSPANTQSPPNPAPSIRLAHLDHAPNREGGNTSTETLLHPVSPLPRSPPPTYGRSPSSSPPPYPPPPN